MNKGHSRSTQAMKHSRDSSCACCEISARALLYLLRQTSFSVEATQRMSKLTVIF
jgi:hypothetical protein